MDETGNSGEKSDPNQPVHLLGCVVFEEDEIRGFEEEMDKLAAKYFGSANSNNEFKGAELFNGNGCCSELQPNVRIEAAREILELVAKSAAGFGYAGVDKRTSYASDHPHRICFGLLLEGLQPFLEFREANGLIVADEYNEIGKTLIADFRRIKNFGTFWGYRSVKAVNIVDTIHFVKSRDSRLVQASDVTTYIAMKAWKIREEKLLKFRDTANDWSTYTEWLKTDYSVSEKATLELDKIRQSLVTFKSKVFP